MTAQPIARQRPLVVPRRHRLARSDNFQTMWCGTVLVDPAGEQWTNDPAGVTCGNCLRLQAYQRRKAAQGEAVTAV